MSTLSDSSYGRNLKCDFPARESFRESLLSDLLSLDAERKQKALSAERGGKGERAPRRIRLDDAELEMLAAAEGGTRIVEDPFEE